MKKFLSLLRAMMSDDMQLFKYKVKSNSSNFKKIAFPLMLSLFVMYAIGIYYYAIAKELIKVNLNFIILTVGLIVPTIFAFIEGIYKSPNILYSGKDNDLLFSLPINKKHIILARLIKMYTFQLLFSILYLLPAYLIYIYFETPSFNFYIISIIMLLLVPIIPTIFSSIIGYLIKKVSIKFKGQKIAETLMVLIIFLGILMFSFNTQNLVNSFIKNASNINDIISKIYYPIGLYLRLINRFNFLDLLKLLLINLVPLAVFVYFVSFNYFKIISKSNEHSLSVNKEYKIKKRNVMMSLIRKEINKYLSSTVYMFNTLFGLILLIMATISLSTNLEKTILLISNNDMPKEMVQMLISVAPKVFYGLIIMMISMTSITSSSISIEGKSFNISKALPVSTKKILLAKVILSDLICIPVVLICDIIFFIRVKVLLNDIIFILLISFIMPNISAIIGILVNLKYPKMNASSDTEVVKQSMSSFVSVLIGMLIGALSIAFLFINKLKFVNISLDLVVIIELIILSLVMLLLFRVLFTYGVKKYRKIEV